MLMWLTMKVTIGLPTADWIEVQLRRVGGSTPSLWLSPLSACLHAQLILAKAPGNRNETNFSFSNWLLPTKSQSGPNLNWPAKSLPAVFSRISKS